MIASYCLLCGDRSHGTAANSVRDISQRQEVSTSETDLLAQVPVTRVTGEDREVNSIDIFEPVYEGVGEIIPDSRFRDLDILDECYLVLSKPLINYRDRIYSK